MRFSRPLLRLPITFDVDALARDVTSLPQSAWVPHPNAFPGNDAVRLITPNGMPTDALDGPMAPTEHLCACPYILELMSELGGTWGRSRLMGLASGAEVPPHVDSHYYWRTHLRIHIPIITNPGVAFTCGGETVQMAPGECWVFDSFQRHEVHNRGKEHRVHLVLDTVGGTRLWDLIEAAESETPPDPILLKAGDGSGRPLRFECVNSPSVMSPWELKCHLAFISEEAAPHRLLADVIKRLDKFAYEWGALWAAYADSPGGIPAYRQLMSDLGRELARLDGKDVTLKNGLTLYHVLGRLVFEVAIGPSKATPLQPGDTAQVRPRLAS
jgi:hypothetical protein